MIAGRKTKALAIARAPLLDELRAAIVDDAEREELTPICKFDSRRIFPARAPLTAG